MRPTLPHDIHFLIIRQVFLPSDLLALSLTCAAFRDEAQRQLFYHPIPRSHEAQTILLAAIALHHKRIAPMVQIYRHLFPKLTEVSPANPQQFDWAKEKNKLREALRATYNLKQFSLLYWPLIWSADLFDGCRFHLTVLEILYPPIIRGATHVLSTFLSHQTSLRHLSVAFRTLTDEDKALMRSPTFCPRLESLGASADMVELLFRNRSGPLKKYYPRSSITSLSDAILGKIEYLTLKFHTLTPTNAPKLASLVVLEMTLNGGFQVAEPPGASEAAYAKLEYLHLIPRLRLLILLITDISEDAYRHFLGGPVVEGLFVKCENLKIVAVTRTRRLKNFEKFHAPRDGREMVCELVSSEEVYRGWKLGPFD